MHFHQQIRYINRRNLIQYPEQAITPSLQTSTIQHQQQPIYPSINQVSTLQDPNLQSTHQIIPVQPISITTPPTVLQPIIIPQSSNSSLNPNHSSSLENSRLSTTSQQITVNTSTLGDL